MSDLSNFGFRSQKPKESQEQQKKKKQEQKRKQKQEQEQKLKEKEKEAEEQKLKQAEALEKHQEEWAFNKQAKNAHQIASAHHNPNDTWFEIRYALGRVGTTPVYGFGYTTDREMAASCVGRKTIDDEWHILSSRNLSEKDIESLQYAMPHVDEGWNYEMTATEGCK